MTTSENQTEQSSYFAEKLKHIRDEASKNMNSLSSNESTSSEPESSIKEL